jgi:hypothetical protein
MRPIERQRILVKKIEYWKSKNTKGAGKDTDGDSYMHIISSGLSQMHLNSNGKPEF